MDLNEMKASWQQAGATAGAEQDLTAIIQTKKHLKVVQNVKIKLLVEAVFMALLLFFFYDIFDGDQKPVYASVALVAGASFYFLSNLKGYFVLQQVVGSGSIRDSLAQLLQSLKQMKILSLTAMLFFSLTLLLFFTSSVDLNLKRLLLSAGMVVFVLVQVYRSASMWNGWINHIALLLEELEE